MLPPSEGKTNHAKNSTEAKDGMWRVRFLERSNFFGRQVQRERCCCVLEMVRFSGSDNRCGDPGLLSSQASASWARETPRGSAICPNWSTTLRSASSVCRYILLPNWSVTQSVICPRPFTEPYLSRQSALHGELND